MKSDDAAAWPGAQHWTAGEAVIAIVPRRMYQHDIQHLSPLHHLTSADAV